MNRCRSRYEQASTELTRYAGNRNSPQLVSITSICGPRTCICRRRFAHFHVFHRTVFALYRRKLRTIFNYHFRNRRIGKFHIISAEIWPVDLRIYREFKLPELKTFLLIGSTTYFNFLCLIIHTTDYRR